MQQDAKCEKSEKQIFIRFLWVFNVFFGEIWFVQKYKFKGIKEKVTKINQRWIWKFVFGPFSFSEICFRDFFIFSSPFWDFLFYFSSSILLLRLSASTLRWKDENFFCVFVSNAFLMVFIPSQSRNEQKNIKISKNIFNQIKPSNEESGIENFYIWFRRFNNKKKSELKSTFVFFMHFNLTHSLDIIKCTNESVKQPAVFAFDLGFIEYFYKFFCPFETPWERHEERELRNIFFCVFVLVQSPKKKPEERSKKPFKIIDSQTGFRGFFITNL